MRYLLFTILFLNAACGDGKRRGDADSSLTDPTMPPVESPVQTGECNSTDAIYKILTFPEVIAKNKELSYPADSVTFITEYNTDKEKVSYRILVGHYVGKKWETFFIFLFDKGNCVDVRTYSPVDSQVISLEKWRQLRTEPVTSAHMTTRAVKLPFRYDDYCATCVDFYHAPPYDTAKCNQSYPSYVMDSNPTLKAIADRTFGESADGYLVLPGVPAYILPFTANDISRYYLVTIADNKLVGKLLIAQADDEQIRYFEVAADHVVSVYTKKDDAKHAKLVGKYNIAADGKINSF